jgi:hypothetical protein
MTCPNVVRFDKKYPIRGFGALEVAVLRRICDRWSGIDARAAANCSGVLFRNAAKSAGYILS